MSAKMERAVSKNSTDKVEDLLHLTFAAICESLEEEFGHGWKRRLATTMGVPESNVHSWIKAGRMSRSAELAFRLRIKNEILNQQKKELIENSADYTRSGHVVKSDDDYAVYRFKNGLGELFAGRIPSEESATRIASLPRLEALVEVAISLVNVFVDNLEVTGFDDDISDLGRAKDFLKRAEDWNRKAALPVERDYEPDFGAAFSGALLSLVTDATRSKDGLEQGEK